MWTALVAGILTILSTSSAGRQQKVSHNGDTIVLCKTDTLLITTSVPSVLKCCFSANAKAKYNNRFKTLLLLENPQLAATPDGVYEIYITSQLPDIKGLSSSQPGFLTVLDLYTLTAPAAKDRLEVDISQHIKKLILQKHLLKSVYFTIRFGAIKLPGGNYSANAGELRLTGIEMVQVKD